MNKVENFFAGLAESYKSFLKQYMFTNIAIVITTLVGVFANYNYMSEFLKHFIIVMGITIINFFMVETYLRNKTQKTIGYIVGFGIGVAIERWLNFNDSSWSIRLTVGYLLIVAVLALIKIIKDSKLEVYEYLTKIFKNLFDVGIIYGVLSIGLSIIFGVFTTLILNDGDTLELMMRMHIALFGLFYVPAILMAITNTKIEVTKFIKILICFVMLPLTVLIMLIIYIYMAKIVIMQDVPSNSIFRITTGIFIVAFPIWTMSYTFKDKNKIIELVSKWMPVAFIPFIGLQIYSLGVRLKDNGLTPVRYLGIIFMIFEVVAIFYSLYKERKYLVRTLQILVGLILVSTILPVVNLQTASNINQAKRLQNAWAQGKEYNELSIEDKEKAASAYRYLCMQDDFDKYLPEYLSKEDIENQIFEEKEYLKYEKYNYEYGNIYYESDNDEMINVEEYKNVKYVQEYLYDAEESELESFSLNEQASINIKDYILNAINQEREDMSGTEYIEQNNVLKIDDNKDFRITTLNISYEMETNGKLNNINFISIDGYILVK